MNDGYRKKVDAGMGCDVVAVGSQIDCTCGYHVDCLSSMHAAVYRLRERGTLLPKPEHPVSGGLQMHTHQMGTNEPHGLQAELAGAGWQDRPAAASQCHGSPRHDGRDGDSGYGVRRSCHSAAPRVGWRRSGKLGGAWC